MLLSLICATLFSSFAFAQQYAGRRVAVPELPAVTGAELAYFNVKDNNGGNVTMLNYFSFPNGKRQDTTKVQRAVLYIHGANGNSQGYYSSLYQALKKATQLNPDVNQETVALMAPYFTSTKNNIERSDITVSFRTKLNPPQTSLGMSVGQVSMRLDSKRPLPTDSCPNYNDWHHGLENYDMDYERTFIRTLGSLSVRLRYGYRHIAYARGLNDFGDYKDGCAPDTTGSVIQL
ncbi:hypothetical protein CPB85DRAFT_1254964 [Mucidula mucida]|nr:hypothetical protein CPB85DRAFT_1254964 [Mucidula mucida]